MPNSAPSYVILGRGNWARRMHTLLATEGRRAADIEETRQLASESDTTYIARLSEAMKRSAAQIAWLCVLPGHHVSLLLQAALDASLHAIVEKPWYGLPEETRRLQSMADARNRVLAVHFEYLMLDEVVQWRRDYHPAAGLNFGGRFLLSRPDQTGTPALENLGSHLLAIREFAAPSAELTTLECAYQRPDERIVWLENSAQPRSFIDLLNHKQPIIQRFIQKVEAALDGAASPCDLNFALRVAEALRAFKARHHS